MTREEVIKELKLLKEDHWDDDRYGHETEQYNDTILALDIAIETLEQESIIDKISAEIADIYCGQYCENPMTADEVREQVLDIIDKYAARVGKKYKHSCCYWENNKCILGKDYCSDDYRCDYFD